MNLVKAYLLTKGGYASLDTAKHGLSEKLTPGGTELVDAYLEAFPVSGTNLNLFDAFLKVVAGRALSVQSRYDLKVLMPQIVLGHRLWADAVGQEERFLQLPRIDFVHNKTNKQIWLDLFAYRGVLGRLGLSQSDLLQGAGLNSSFRVVEPGENIGGDKLIRLEQTGPLAYTDRPSDRVPGLVAVLRNKVWTTVLNTPPYRRYYLYVCPTAEQPFVLPQILATYALIYYLGSITRYRPHHFDAIMSGEYGPFIAAVLNDQPMQFVYLMASEFSEQEVTKAAII
jgi:hypothetical protein